VLSGTRLLETNPLFEAMAKERGFYGAKLLEEIARTGSVHKINGVPDDVKKLFVTALDIRPEWHVRMQAVFQKYTDNAVSKTVNFPHDATIEDVGKVYQLAFHFWQIMNLSRRIDARKANLLKISIEGTLIILYTYLVSSAALPVQEKPLTRLVTERLISGAISSPWMPVLLRLESKAKTILVWICSCLLKQKIFCLP
jgi:ribonucleoside-diphosphate reductase alpha chain